MQYIPTYRLVEVSTSSSGSNLVLDTVYANLDISLLFLNTFMHKLA